MDTVYSTVVITYYDTLHFALAVIVILPPFAIFGVPAHRLAYPGVKWL